MKKILSGWGNRPKVESECLTSAPNKLVFKKSPLICFANGKSYGDSALNRVTFHTGQWNHFLDFDSTNGVLSCQSGVLLSEILETFVSRGWMLKVMPGTKYITVGGAIASDVHGKNHHMQGCFSESLLSFELLLPDGEIKSCRPNYNKDFFQATCGGMGLTGIILSAKIQLQKISGSQLKQTNLKTQNLRETFDAMESIVDEPFSVAWIDCITGGESLGRGIVSFGQFEENGRLEYQPKKQNSIPFHIPGFALNSWSMKSFNHWHYKRTKEGSFKTDLDSFFFPLDKIQNWNRIYGKKGFYQYQFVLPKESSYEGMKKILELISKSRRASFLAVLKLCGKQNNNWLSFPMKGYSLALDFKYHSDLEKLFSQLDELVHHYGGRIYLAKDARVGKSVFEQGYQKIEKFRSFRKEHGLDKLFQSLQSQRLGL
jgi:decaprenylphospho-beta-D-ribofuranose 2-oxidase